MSASSGLGGSSAVMVRGSSAMPQMGQAPGASRMTSGCIGQVQLEASPAWAMAAAGGTW